MYFIRFLLDIYFQICINIIKIILHLPSVLLLVIWFFFYNLYYLPRFAIYLPFQLIDKIFGLNKEFLYKSTKLDLKIEQILEPLIDEQLNNKFTNLIEHLYKTDSFR